jgi:hypothetical protein
MAIATNGVVITDAIKYVQGKMNHLNKIEKTKMHDVNEDIKQRKREREAGEEDFLYTTLYLKSKVKDD